MNKMEIVTFVFREAKTEDKEQIMQLYRNAIGTEGCTWSEEYPNKQILLTDLSKHNLFCMENQDKEIVGAISIDEDEEVDRLECWNRNAGKMAEIARLVVREDCQNKGIARELIKNVIKVLKERQYKSVHYLVSKYNNKALASYKKLDFKCVGESDILDNDWYCYEMLLDEKNYKIFTIPNILSFIRLILVGLFFVLYSDKGSNKDNVWAIIVLILSGITDFLDGKIARRFNMVSELGKILDPVADKATEAVIAICLMKRYKILICLLILFAIKETFMSACGLIVIRKTGENNGAKWYGKVSTFAFYIVMITLLIIRHIPLLVANAMIIMCMFFMAFAFVMYARLYYQMLKRNKCKTEQL